MDELVKQLMEKAGLTEAQARAAVEVFLAYVKHEDNRQKMAAVNVASAVAAKVI